MTCKAVMHVVFVSVKMFRIQDMVGRLITLKNQKTLLSVI